MPLFTRFLVLSLTFAVGFSNISYSASCTPEVIKYQIDAFVDGDSRLIIEKDKLYWEHLSATPPGKWQRYDYPTIVSTWLNDEPLMHRVEWQPDWEAYRETSPSRGNPGVGIAFGPAASLGPDLTDQVTPLEQHGTKSNNLSPMVPALPTKPTNVTLMQRGKNPYPMLIQAPTEENGYKLIVEFKLWRGRLQWNTAYIVVSSKNCGEATSSQRIAEIDIAPPANSRENYADAPFIVLADSIGEISTLSLQVAGNDDNLFPVGDGHLRRRELEKSNTQNKEITKIIAPITSGGDNRVRAQSQVYITADSAWEQFGDHNLFLWKKAGTANYLLGDPNNSILKAIPTNPSQERSLPDDLVDEISGLRVKLKSEGLWRIGQEAPPELSIIDMRNHVGNSFLADERILNVPGPWPLIVVGDPDLDNVVLHPDLKWSHATGTIGVKKNLPAYELRLGDESKTLIIGNPLSIYNFSKPGYIGDPSVAHRSGTRTLGKAQRPNAHSALRVARETRARVDLDGSGRGMGSQNTSSPSSEGIGSSDRPKEIVLRGGIFRPAPIQGFFGKTYDLRNGWPNKFVIPGFGGRRISGNKAGVIVIGDAGQDAVVFEEPGFWKRAGSLPAKDPLPDLIRYEQVAASSDVEAGHIFVQKNLVQPQIGPDASGFKLQKKPRQSLAKKIQQAQNASHLM